jgi:hypothetical protein
VIDAQKKEGELRWELQKEKIDLWK